MENNFISLIDESINLELNVSNLYSLFFKLFPEDADFWWKLVLEEKNHAALIRSGKEYFEQLNKFPHDILSDSLQKLKDTNSKLETMIQKFESDPPLRQEAFNMAFDLENSAGEVHFQNFMSKEGNLKIADIFKQLNKDDKDHSMRIFLYMEKQGIPLQTEKL